MDGLWEGEGGRGMARTASNLQEPEVLPVGHAIQLWSFLPALICLVCLW